MIGPLKLEMADIRHLEIVRSPNINEQEAQLSQRPRDASCHWKFR